MERTGTEAGQRTSDSDHLTPPEVRVYDASPERRFFTSLLDDDAGFVRGASSGVRINSGNALQNSTVVLGCVRVLAETVASLPLHIYKMLPNGSRERCPGWLDHLLSVAPNSWQTSFEWLELSMTHLGLYGSCFSEIVPGPQGSVSELLPLHPSRMKTSRIENGRLRFEYTEPNGAKTVYNQDQIFRVTWMSTDGINGSVPIELGKEAIGLARACELHGSRYFGNGARPGVVLETDQSMTPEAAERLRENWERVHRGPDKASKTAVLTGGLKAHELDGNTNNESQFLEARRFQVEEICRLYRVPPHMIQDLTRATYSNIEQQSIDFVQYSVLPWLRRFEKAILRDLIAQPTGYFAMFDTRQLLRGDAASRMAFYTAGLDRGIFSINDIRGWEGLNPIDGGDIHFFPLNMTTVEAIAKQGAEPHKMQATDTPSQTSEQSSPDAPAAQPTDSAIETDFASAALNGAQVSSLLEILANIVSGLLSHNGAIATIGAAFPKLSQQQIERIVAGVNQNATPVGVEPTVQPEKAT